MLIPTLVLHTGDREGSLWILGECGSQVSLGVAFLWKIMQCYYEIWRHLFKVQKYLVTSVGMAQIQRGLCNQFKISKLPGNQVNNNYSKEWPAVPVEELD